MRLLVSCRFAPCSETPFLAVRHATDVAEVDGIWRESYAPDCWLAGRHNPEVQFGHDSDAIGLVVVITSHEGWHHADMTIDTDDPAALERIKVGAPVSLGARTIRRDDDVHLHIRRHTLAQLQHIAIARHGEIAKISGAKITSVRRMADATPATSDADWLAGLPDYWVEALQGDKPGEVTALLGKGDRVEYRWDGRRFVSAGAFARVAA